MVRTVGFSSSFVTDLLHNFEFHLIGMDLTHLENSYNLPHCPHKVLYDLGLVITGLSAFVCHAGYKK